MKLRKGADILVATPGRLLDLYQQQLSLISYNYLCSMKPTACLIWALFTILNALLSTAEKRQNLLFSATFSDDIRALAKGLIHNLFEISVAPANTTAKSVTQWAYPVDKSKRTSLLKHLIKTNNWQQVLVFTRTKHGANRLCATSKKPKLMQQLFMVIKAKVLEWMHLMVLNSVKYAS